MSYAATHDHIYGGRKSIEHRDYVNESIGTESLWIVGPHTGRAYI